MKVCTAENDIVNFSPEGNFGEGRLFGSVYCKNYGLLGVEFLKVVQGNFKRLGYPCSLCSAIHNECGNLFIKLSC